MYFFVQDQIIDRYIFEYEVSKQQEYLTRLKLNI